MKPSFLTRLHLRSRSTPIRVRLTVALALLVGAFALFFNFYVPQRLEQQALASVAERARSIGQMTGFMAGIGILFEDPESIREAFRVAQQDEDVVYLVLTDTTGHRLASEGMPTAERVRFTDLEAGPLVPGEAIYRAQTPVFQDGEQIGRLYLGLSLLKLQAEVQQTQLAVAWVSFLLFLAGLASVIVVGTAITKPLGQITHTVERIASGDLSQRARVPYRDEIGYLARAFNRMVNRLTAAQQHLQTLNADLRQREEALRHEIAERQRYEHELVEAKNQAEEMARLKSSFLTNMSHEIRTPLAGIIGLSQVLMQEVQDEHRELVELITGSGERLLDTLNSVLDLARLDAGRVDLSLETLHIGAEVTETVRVLRPLAERKGLALEVDAWPNLYAQVDRTSLQRILTNLVGNAIKFTERGHIRVLITGTAEHVRLQVVDTGIGISESFLSRLFQEFYQESEGLARSHEGSGLGLAITRRLVELQHGTIEVASQKGHGSVFTVTFPRVEQPQHALPPGFHALTLAPEAHSAPPPKAPNPAPPAPRPVPTVPDASHRTLRILAVEDSRETGVVLRLGLNPPHDVDLVVTGQDAVSRVRDHTYDVALIDINLGVGYSGLDVLREIRANPTTAHLPCIALTAYALPGDRDQFLRAGFDAYLAKPFSLEALSTVLLDTLAHPPGAPPTTYVPDLPGPTA